MNDLGPSVVSGELLVGAGLWVGPGEGLGMGLGATGTAECEGMKVDVGEVGVASGDVVVGKVKSALVG